MIRSALLATFLILGHQACWAGEAPARLHGEISAERILNGESDFPPSPTIDVPVDLGGLDRTRLGTVPPPGVHPRVLIGPDQLPDLKRRLQETNVGRELSANLRKRLDSSIRSEQYWGSSLYELLASGRLAEAEAMVREKKGLPPPIGHYQPFLYAIVLEAFDAWIQQDRIRGDRAAAAVATYAALVRPAIDATAVAPLHDDVWRAKASDDHAFSLRDAVGGHLLGYAYDFSEPFMNESQRSTVRGAIAAATTGRLWMGARLPRHFRNWNWIAVGLQQPLLALAIEGEEGYDPRVYRLGVEIARDYLTYGISAKGVSTEAVGYTQFGLVWANPFFVAAQRRGADLLGHGHHRAMLDWYLHTTVPARDQWLSSGDGGDGGPAIGTVLMWRFFFPKDPKAAAVWRNLTFSRSGKVFDGKFHLIEAMIWAADDSDLGKPPPESGDDLAALGIPQVVFDPARGWLTARSGWGRNAASMQFECRTDSVGASHEHADRGNFVFAALGRVWAKDNFRSVETRHHNSILIDGLGQGYWPGPGIWLGLQEFGTLLVAACDARDAYGWFWPKQILTEDPDRFERFQFPRWSSYGTEARTFQTLHAGLQGERDPRPAVVSFWKGYDDGDPRLWDEDGWPLRFPHNPVARAFRTLAFERGKDPWLLIVDDIQKDGVERLYEWLMQTGMDTEIASIQGNDMILSDATNDSPKGEPRLLVRILNANDPEGHAAYQSRPSFRLETFERRDSLAPEASGLSGSRSFGLDKRLVIPSRSTAPDFRILLYPFRNGDPLPETSWSEDRTRLTITSPSATHRLSFKKSDDGRTLVAPIDSHSSQ